MIIFEEPTVTVNEEPTVTVKCKLSTLLTEFSTALTTILPILFQYCYKCYYSDNRNL